LIRPVKLVEHPPRVAEIAQGIPVAFLIFLRTPAPSTRTTARQLLAGWSSGTAWPWVEFLVGRRGIEKASHIIHRRNAAGFITLFSIINLPLRKNSPASIPPCRTPP